MTGRTLVAGVGNIFLSDDGFGVEVASRLAGGDLPPGVTVTDYGIRGMHLAYDLAAGYGTAILVDATARGGTPGTIYVIEPDLPPRAAAPAGGPAAASPVLDAHGMQPEVVLGLLGLLGGGRPERIMIVGCEPGTVAEGIGLSAPVAASVPEAARIVLELAAGDTAGPRARAAAETGSVTKIKTATDTDTSGRGAAGHAARRGRLPAGS